MSKNDILCNNCRLQTQKPSNYHPQKVQYENWRCIFTPVWAIFPYNIFCTKRERCLSFLGICHTCLETMNACMVACMPKKHALRSFPRNVLKRTIINYFSLRKFCIFPHLSIYTFFGVKNVGWRIEFFHAHSYCVCSNLVHDSF